MLLRKEIEGKAVDLARSATCPESVLFLLLSASSAFHLRFSEISVTVSFLIRGLHFCSDESFVVFVLSDKSVHG